jgi:hypothetical protein
MLMVRLGLQEAAKDVMCRSHLSVSWEGLLFDCDFNQQLGMAMRRDGKDLTVWDIESVEDLRDMGIRTGLHCYGWVVGPGWARVVGTLSGHRPGLCTGARLAKGPAARELQPRSSSAEAVKRERI